MPEPTLEHVIKPLRVYLAEQRAAGARPLAGVREVRVQSDQPTTPTAVTLFIVTDEPPAVDRALWHAAFDVLHAHADANGIALAGPEIATLWDMCATDYLTSHAVSDADSS